MMITPVNANEYPGFESGSGSGFELANGQSLDSTLLADQSDGLTRRQFGRGLAGLAVLPMLGACAPVREIGPGQAERPLTAEQLEKQRYDAVMAVSGGMAMSILTALGEPQEADNLRWDRDEVFVKYRNRGARVADNSDNGSSRGRQLWFELSRGGRVFAAYKQYDDGELLRSVEVNMRMRDTNPAWEALRALGEEDENPNRQQVVSAVGSLSQLELVSLEFTGSGRSCTIVVTPPDVVDPVTNSAPLTLDGVRLETGLDGNALPTREQHQIKFVNRMNEANALNSKIANS